MKHILKAAEPPSLTMHRQQAHACFDNYQAKDDLRDALLKEQGWICCYCMRTIAASNMKIEHWASQKRHPNRELHYGNLLAACDGAECGPKKLQHCDTHKGDADMTINPTDRARNCEVHVKYGGDGTVYADDERINSDLDSTLNLNLQRLCDNRKAVLDGALENLRRRRPDGIWTKSFLEGEIHAWRERSSTEHFREYCQIVVCHLRLKQKQVSK